MNKWFYINFLILVLLAWKMMTDFHGLPQFFGFLGFLVILYNWTRHAIFSTIRSDLPRVKRIKYAKLSKAVLPYHKWTGTLALILLLGHAYLIIQHYGWWWQSLKFNIGILVLMVLIFQAVSGWLRWYRTTILRRYLHWVSAFILIGLALLHILL